MHLRCKTLASLMSYIKTKPSAFAKIIQLSTSTDAGTAIHNDMPVHEPNVVDELIATIGVLAGESSTAAASRKESCRRRRATRQVTQKDA